MTNPSSSPRRGPHPTRAEEVMAIERELLEAILEANRGWLPRFFADG